MNKEIEKYKVHDKRENLAHIINKGKFYNQIIDVLKTNFDKRSTDTIINNVDRIYESFLNLNEIKNLLLVGKVQSGKTSNLKLLTGLLFDNDYQLGVIYGGYSEELLKQTIERFKNAYRKNINEKDIVIIDTYNTNIDGLRDVLPKMISKNKILILSMKNSDTIKKVTNALSGTEFYNYKTFIIDDEGDQASLNTEIRNNGESPTYKNITSMIEIFKTPLYLSSTATPNAIIFQPSTSIIDPKSVVLIEPGEEYYGADFFHTTSDNIIIVSENSEEIKVSNDMKKAFHHFLISSAILHIEGINNTSMIVHTHKDIYIHKQMKRDFEAIKKFYENIIEKDKNYFYGELNTIYKKPYFDEKIIGKYSLDVLIKIIKNKVFPNLFFILYNSKGSDDLAFKEFKSHTVSIGGELIQRGVTFNNLVTSYFTRSPKSGGNMDTTLQRARWFGYRKKIIHLMRVFTTEELSDNFSILTDVEQQLWDQFYSVQEGELTLDDIAIRADSKMNVARQNVISIESTNFRRKWFKQNLGIFDSESIVKNNTIVKNYLKRFSKNKISLARIDGELNVECFEDSSKNFKEKIINKLTIFKYEPLNKIFDYDMENEIIDVLIMDSLKLGSREREFNKNNVVNNLHQGQDKSNKDSSKFLGDSKVIKNKDRITIQIFKVLPKKDGKKKHEFIQYMFAVYLPVEGKYFRRKKL
ncbi:MAG: Z1 domain-containing protein [Candidatus Izemoplasmatales bacterium]